MMNIYMAVTMDKYELPIAVATTAKELADMCNVTENAIYSSLSHVKSGITGRSRYVKCEVDMIELKTHFSDWHEVDRATALRYCALLYNGITGRGRLAKTNAHVRGIAFTGKELVDEYERISTERMREAT